MKIHEVSDEQLNAMPTEIILAALEEPFKARAESDINFRAFMRDTHPDVYATQNRRAVMNEVADQKKKYAATAPKPAQTPQIDAPRPPAAGGSGNTAPMRKNNELRENEKFCPHCEEWVHKAMFYPVKSKNPRYADGLDVMCIRHRRHFASASYQAYRVKVKDAKTMTGLTKQQKRKIYNLRYRNKNRAAFNAYRRKRYHAMKTEKALLTSINPPAQTPS